MDFGLTIKDMRNLSCLCVLNRKLHHTWAAATGRIKGRRLSCHCMRVVPKSAPLPSKAFFIKINAF